MADSIEKILDDCTVSPREYCHRHDCGQGIYDELADYVPDMCIHLVGRAVAVMRREYAVPDGMKWPRFDDGTPVEYGDYIIHDGRPERVQGIYLYNGSYTLSLTGRDHEILHTAVYGAPVERWQAVGADGRPIKRGDIVYGEDGTAFEVTGILRKKRHCVMGRMADGHCKALKPEWLTHEEPDSWERIINDAITTVPFGDEESIKASFVRRCKKLAGGDAR